MSKRPYYDRARAALDEAHKACFNHPDRDVLGMSHGPFSGVNDALGIIAELEDYKHRMDERLSSGYRILAPGSLDKETLEAAAKVARKEAFNAISGAVVCHGEMTHREMENDADDIAAAIRALGGGEG